MANKYVIDTHALIWFLEGNQRLGQAAQTVMSDPTSAMVLSLIALAEAVDIVQKRRTAISSVADLLLDVTTDPRIELFPLTFEVLQQSLLANAVPEMHDRLIVATALYLESLGHQVSVISRDVSIVTSQLVTIVW
jgi:PIN domain nuclease of toxin-antitoxin system